MDKSERAIEGVIELFKSNPPKKKVVFFMEESHFDKFNKNG